MTKDFLRANLYDLWRVAHEFLPNVTDVYRRVANKALDVEGNSGPAFGNPTAEHATGGRVYIGGSRVFPYFQAVHEQYTKLMSETADNLADTARVLAAVVAHYESTDAEAAAYLRQKMIDHGEVAAIPRLLDEPSVRDSLAGDSPL